jgi:hypothetical protein
MPDSLHNDGISVRKMLLELATPAGELRGEHRELEEHFAGALNPLVSLLGSAKRYGSGEAHFATRQLLARAISDLIASVHLLAHGYLNQGYGTMRTAYEALDLVDLLSTKDDEAALWVNTEQGHRDFAPGAVRRRLGRNSYDEIYSKLSEFTHPRFEASKLGAIGRREEGAERMEVLIRVGPFLIDEMADHWLAATFLVPLTFGVLARLAHLVSNGSIEAAAWDRAALAMQGPLNEMADLIVVRLADFDIDASAFAATWKEIPNMIAEINSEGAEE